MRTWDKLIFWIGKAEEAALIGAVNEQEVEIQPIIPRGESAVKFGTVEVAHPEIGCKDSRSEHLPPCH